MSLLPNGLVKWGIAGAGLISGDFVNAIINNLDSSQHQVVAVAARNQQTAKIFAIKYGIPNAMEGYEALAACDDVNVVYVGTINTTHLDVVKLLLKAGKHVICEKPLGMNLKETQEMVDLARKQKLFCMEAIWSRCLPAYEKVKKLLEKGTIGDVILAESMFGRVINAERMLKKELGGGTTLDLGIYNIQFSQLAFGGKKPDHVTSTGHLNHEGGVDTDVSGTFIYNNGGTARFQTHCRVNLNCEGTIYGTKGTITLPEPFWTATQLKIKMNPGEKCSEPETFMEFPIGKSIVKTGVNYTFDNSANLAYEADHVRKCLLEGSLESPNIPLNESLLIAELMESVRKQVGVSYHQD